MNILFTKAYDIEGRRPLSNQDYLSDTVFHGLKQLYGDSVVDFPVMWHVYKNYFGEGKYDLARDTYGRGFSFCATVENDFGVDRTDLENKIKSGYFDLIFGVPYWPTSLSDLAETCVPKNKIVWLDGHDIPTCLVQSKFVTGVYYKRELTHRSEHMRPISFSFPEEKVRPLGSQKVMEWFPFPPVKNSGGGTGPYPFLKENDYYDAYAQSLFGYTVKKMGWDCMRHYEIMACGTLPYWADIHECPEFTCTHLPKQMLSEIKNAVESHGAASFFGVNRGYYDDMSVKVRKHFLENCTTVAAAKRIISDMTC